MKLSSLFAKYLYQHKDLNLPGIGNFHIDSSEQIKYTQRTITSADEEFINFIRTATGKIRPLAESDLESFLDDGKILLNIGKPFHLEGIGSLLKNKAGIYEFMPGDPSADKLQYSAQEKPRETEKKSSVFENEPAQSHGMTKFLIFTALVGGIVFIIWAGYNVFKRYSNSAPKSETVADTAQTQQSVDTSRANAILAAATKIIDSVKKSSLDTPDGYYKFVIEKTGNKRRALRRYQQLADNLTDIKMETNPDSTAFSLYFQLPATPSDTLRIKDSLRIWYASKTVWVER